MYIGIDLGGTKILTAVADSRGRIIASSRVDTQADLGPKKVIKNIIRSVEDVLTRSDTPLSKISKIGIGAPGPIINESIIVSPPNLKGWKKVNLKHILKTHFNKPVIVENDANAAAYAEYKFGAGKGTNNMVYITVSTGIGGGIIIDRKMLRGKLGTAGEIGHMIVELKGNKCGCGNIGCLEAMASGVAIAKMAGMKSAVDVKAAAEKGNKKALKAIDTAGMYIGIAIANLNNLLNPDLFVIGGGVTNMGKLLFTPINKWAKANSMSENKKTLKIAAAKLKNDVGVLGAIAICMEGLPAEASSRRQGDD